MMTFLFTDIEGSTRLWEADARAMSAALGRHDALLHAVIAAGGGHVFKTAGDAFCAVFTHPAAAATAAVEGQRALAAEAFPGTAPLRVRMAIHTGEAEARGGDYFGPALNRVARLLASAHGEQVLLSRAAADLVRDCLPPEMTLRNLGEHALKDLQSAERVFQVVAPGLRTDFPPLRTPQRSLRQVPQPSTPLIGREPEVAAARTILGFADAADNGRPETGDWQPARLLTLTGPGGAGKTRLAVHLASTLGVELDDGAAFVPLAALTDPAFVPVAIAGAFELGDGGGDAPWDLVLDHLRDREALLVLDNFEQVMGAAGLIADLLTGCPRLRVLVTSRERLNLRGEHDYPLHPLALPETRSSAGASPSLADIARSEAVRLFVERAQTVKPGFALTEENAETVAEIVHRLDGLPLAIELAAARVRLHPPRALLDRFDRRLDLLNRGHRDLPARQQTMRDTIAWSYDLLDPAEQRLFACLSIFAGGATLDAVADVAAALPDGDADSLDLIESLADKSLVVLHEDEDETRVTMLQTIRDFSQEQLAASPFGPPVAERHANYYLLLAEEAEPLLAGKAQQPWLDRLEREQANLRAAIGWLRERGDAERALRLGGALWRFWWLRGDMSEGRSHLESLLGEAGNVSAAVRAKALNGAGVLAESQGDWQTAASFHQESLEISRQLGNADDVAWSLNNLGVVASNQSDYERAAVLLQESLAVAEEAGLEERIAAVLIDLGLLAYHQGNAERATALLTRSLGLLRTHGDTSQVARALSNLGTFAFERGAIAEAQSLLTESLALHRGVGDRQSIASTLNNLGEVASALGDDESALGLYLESHALALESGNQLNAAIAMENLAVLTRRRGDERTAQLRFREALLLYRAIDDRQGIGACLSGLAAIAAAGGDHDEAALLLGAAAALRGPGDDAADDDDTAQTLRVVMGDAAFERAWQSGHAMPLVDVIERVAERAHALERPRVA
jgi:predicted ATPase/class 3 adenylate cyclase